MSIIYFSKLKISILSKNFQFLTFVLREVSNFLGRVTIRGLAGGSKMALEIWYWKVSIKVMLSKRISEIFLNFTQKFAMHRFFSGTFHYFRLRWAGLEGLEPFLGGQPANSDDLYMYMFILCIQSIVTDV